MFCPNCGKNVADGVKFCPECGGLVAQASAPSYNPVVNAGGAAMAELNKKRNIIMIGLAVVMVLLFIFTYNAFTSIEGKWEVEYFCDSYGGERDYPDKGQVIEYEFDGDVIRGYENGKQRASTSYSISGEYIIANDAEPMHYDCDGFSLTLCENVKTGDDTMHFTRVWTFGFIFKMLLLIGLIIASGCGIFIIHKKKKLSATSSSMSYEIR